MINVSGPTEKTKTMNAGEFSTNVMCQTGVIQYARDPSILSEMDLYYSQKPMEFVFRDIAKTNTFLG